MAVINIELSVCPIIILLRCLFLHSLNIKLENTEEIDHVAEIVYGSVAYFDFFSFQPTKVNLETECLVWRMTQASKTKELSLPRQSHAFQKDEIVGLCRTAFELFAKDFSVMHKLSINCLSSEPCSVDTKALQGLFSDFVIISTIYAYEPLDVTFQLVFDGEGLSALAGIAKKQTKTKSFRKRKKLLLEEALDVYRVLKQTAHTLLGCWPRACRQLTNLKGKFTQADLFVGNPWEKSERLMSLKESGTLFFIPFELTVPGILSFHCSALFPEALFESAPPAVDKQSTGTDGAEEQEQNDDFEKDTRSRSKKVEKTTKKFSKKEKTTPHLVQEKVTPQGVPDRSTGDIVKQSKKSRSRADLKKVKTPRTGGKKQAHNKTNRPNISKINAGDMMRKKLRWVDADDSVEQTLDEMEKTRTDYILVGSDSYPQGIISKSDLAGAMSPFLRPEFQKWRRPLDDATMKIRVKWIMRQIADSVKTDTKLAEIIDEILKKSCDAIPVTDKKDKLVGLVTTSDILKAIQKPPSKKKVPQTSK